MTIGGLPPLTPSGAHDQAYKRDRGHDAMQAAFLDFLRSRPVAAVPKGAFVHREVEAERPLRRRGQVVAYVDAIEILTVNLTTVVSLFEIKPRIHTVFGIIRQAKSQLALAVSDIPADQHYCHIIVPASEPKLLELRAEWPLTWAWGVTFERVEGSA
jgi:hypothetical protein